MKPPFQEPEERALVEAAQKDRSRFAELYELYFDRIYAFIARRTGDRTEAQDLTAEVFHQALAHLGSFEWRGAPFSAWLFRIASNAIADYFQRREREPATLAAEAAAPPTEETAIEEVETRARLFRMVRALPDDQRRVIQMRFAEEKSIREIADALGRSEGAIKQLQFRALTILRTRLRRPHA